ncbi:hypothetical protein GCM10010123_18610 [Pilimelia anulata]|uniref:Antitoxin n=1 Tax=Pilimelia anulata TaxID=53371 RepID=A0A8J3B6S3_9ACTN|nr:Rv0909 family putative TA system antitoxin [Pilimelia anulata]GGJ89282.1 hypothetical protein GCM10010123_18610 [Pilimelia anulata]
MGIGDALNKLGDLAKKKAKEDDALVRKGIDAAGDAFDRVTKGKYAGQTDKVQEQLRKKAEEHKRDQH